MIKVKVLYILLTVAALGIAGPVSAQPRIGDKMPEFNLPATNSQFYGVDYAKEQVSVLFFMGHW